MTAWTADGTEATRLVSDGTRSDPAMTYTVVGAAGEWSFTTQALADVTLTLPYTYEGFHGFFQSEVSLYAVVIHNGQQTETLLQSAGPVDCCMAPSDNFSFHDTATFTVQTGDTFGFRLEGSHYDVDNRLQGWFTVAETGLTSDDRLCIGYDAAGRTDRTDRFCDDLDACAGPDLLTDLDSDGVCNEDDVCPDADDTLDADDDGTPDACDACPEDATGDSDGDDVCDGDDRCPGGDDSQDVDNDGLPDACDPCPQAVGGDSDGDGVCDAQDVCPGFSDTEDADSDGVPDRCDVCPDDLFDDSDNDGVCDSDDLCDGFPDSLDVNEDGVPDDCEACPAQDDRDGDGTCDASDICPDDPQDDSDNDGVCDSDDACQGMRDSDDTDSDGIPDGCDVCPDDPNNDADGDGVCWQDDVCDGDDTLDRDLDGTPDACDPCPDDLADRCLETSCIDCESTEMPTRCSTSGGPLSTLPGVLLLMALRRRRRVAGRSPTPQ